MGRPMRWLGTPLGRLWDGVGTPNGTAKILNVCRPWDGGTPDLPPSHEKGTSAPRVRSLLSSDARWFPENTETTGPPSSPVSTWCEPRILREIRSYAQSG